MAEEDREASSTFPFSCYGLLSLMILKPYISQFLQVTLTVIIGSCSKNVLSDA